MKVLLIMIRTIHLQCRRIKDSTKSRPFLLPLCYIVLALAQSDTIFILSQKRELFGMRFTPFKKYDSLNYILVKDVKSYHC